MSLVRGTRIASYEILEPLGAGGMGEVYRARDSKLARDVALKVLPASTADDAERRARLLREAHAAASLQHPNICTIFDVGEADGRAYIAMELIEGRTLSQRLADGPLPLQDAVRYGVQLAEAMAHAHDRRIVHRDLKSANTMVTPDGRIKVLDFGLAKPLVDEAFADTVTKSHGTLTQPGVVLGTLAYMAPEQLRGQAADERSDLWGLGIILYEMTTGVRPFGGASAFEVTSAILREPLPPLPARVPGALRLVIERCLEKEPGRRYQRASEVRAALETATTAPVSAVGSNRRTEFARLGVVALLVTGLVAAAATVWLKRPTALPAGGEGPRAIRSIAVLPLENRSGNPNEDYFVAGIHEALIIDLARIDLDKVIAKPSVDAYRGTRKPLAEIGRELGVQGLVTGSVMRVNDRIQLAVQLINASDGAVIWANRYERGAGDVLALQNEFVRAIAREVQSKLSPEQTARLAAARPVNAVAHDAYLKWRSTYAAFTNSQDWTKLTAVVAQLEDVIRIDPGYAPPYASLAVLYNAASQTSIVPPKDSFPKAKAAALKAVSLDGELADAHAALGEVYLWHDWNWTEAEREIARALQLNPDSPDALRSHESYLTLITARPDEALRTAQRILDLDPLNPFSRVQTIWTAFFTRRHDESIARAQSLLEVGPNNILVPLFLASNYAVQKRGADVAVECGKIMQMIGSAYVMQLIGVCAWAHGVSGQPETARQLIKRLEQPPPGVWLDPAVMGQAYGAVGDVDRAIEWYRRGLQEHSLQMAYLKVGPLFDTTRGDPRFQALLQQMNFPE